MDFIFFFCFSCATSPATAPTFTKKTKKTTPHHYSRGLLLKQIAADSQGGPTTLQDTFLSTLLSFCVIWAKKNKKLNKYIYIWCGTKDEWSPGDTYPDTFTKRNIDRRAHKSERNGGMFSFLCVSFTFSPSSCQNDPNLDTIMWQRSLFLERDTDWYTHT